MIFRKLRRHQWQEFRRSPMFEREIALKILMCFMFLLFGIQLFFAGFFLVDLLSEYGVNNSAIDSLNYYLIYIVLFDFTIKYIKKQRQSIRIAPYLTIPVQRSKLFNFVLFKEFTSMWNLYIFFFLIPFTFRAIPAYYGYSGVVLYLLFFYLLCVGISLLVNIANDLLNRNSLYLFLPYIIVAAIVGTMFIPGINIESSIAKAFEFILEKNIIPWAVILLFFSVLWNVNLIIMRDDVYRALQGEKVSEAGTYTLPFIRKFGKYGMFINLELKMILRSKRLKNMPYYIIIIPILYFVLMNFPFHKISDSSQLFPTIYTLGWIGVVLGPLLFTYESSFFDCLMTKRLSLFNRYCRLAL